MFGINKEKEVIKRLKSKAGNIIEMLKVALNTENGLDLTIVLLYAAGLAGIACHEAVKASGGKFMVVQAANGKKFYFGDDVNKYLFEDENAIIPIVTVISHNTNEEIKEIISDIADKLSAGENSVRNLDSEGLYRQVKQCWDGIFGNMTSKYCKDATEWPILFGIVLQNVIGQALQVGAPKEEVGKMAIECAVLLSKFDEDSF